jgi:hypothetical protein
VSPGRRICPEKKKKANTPDKTETGQPLDHYISHTSLVKENKMLIINTTTEDKMANTIVTVLCLILFHVYEDSYNIRSPDTIY